MNWYRITLMREGRKLKPVELPAHSAQDAVVCGIAKAQLLQTENVTLVDVECIEDPAHAKEAERRKLNAQRAFVNLADQLHQIVVRHSGDAEEPESGSGGTP